MEQMRCWARVIASAESTSRSAGLSAYFGSAGRGEGFALLGGAQESLARDSLGLCSSLRPSPYPERGEDDDDGYRAEAGEEGPNADE
jgi:hypothetical protein